MGEQIALVTLLLISIPAVFMITINWEDSKYDANIKVIGYHWWAYLSPITWAIIVIGLVLGGIVCIIFKGSEYAEQFNNWLNKK
jgi:TRAP-type C4-dicarboxylate transport system permease large subunit